MCNSLVGRLRGMQLIIPHKVVQALWLWGADASSGNITVVVEPGDIGRGCEEFIRVVVDVGQEAVGIEDGHLRSWVAILDLELEGDAITEVMVDQLGVLLHFEADLRDICWLQVIPS